MRIVYDARVVDRPWSGLGRFTGELLLALLASELRADVHLDVIAPLAADEAANPYLRALAARGAGARCTIHRFGTPAITLAQHWTVPRFLRRLGGDVYFYPHFDVPASVPMPFVFVVHDLLPLKVAGYVERLEHLKQAYFRGCVRRGLRRAARCYAVSKTTRQDLLDEFGDGWASKIGVSYEGASLSVERADPALRQALGLTGPYLLYVGTRRPNKNVRFTLDLFRELRALGYCGELVMAGATRNFGFDADAYASAVGGVRMLGPVDDDQLASLYAGTDALVMLSLYEGFGLPVIEAARFGRPMLLSDGGAVAEVAPSTACVIPLGTPAAEAARRALAYLRSAQQPADLGAYHQTFSWPAAARAVFPDAY